MFKVVMPWRVLTVAALIIVAYGSLTPISGDELFFGVDKLIHAFTYACLFILVWLAFPGSVLRGEIHFSLLLFGIFLELAQARTGHRTMDGADVIANFTGTGGGNLLLSYMVDKLPGRISPSREL
jgi:VanZ family protein